MSQPGYRVACGLLLLVLACGCRTAGPALTQLPEAPDERAAYPSFGEFLPCPSALSAQVEQTRAVSYWESDCIKHGDEFSGSLPNQNVLPGTNNSVELHASWSEATGMHVANLAYCIYGYTLADFDRQAELHYRWLIQPPSYDSVWFGLANWQADCWDWRTATQAGVSNWGSVTPYLNGSDLYAVVVCANNGTSNLRYLRVGEQPAANIVIDVKPRSAGPPALIGFFAQDSTIPVGTITDYAWDMDHNGSYEKDTGSSTYASRTFETAGSYLVGLRITSSYDEYFTGTATAELIEPWAHSWGSDQNQNIRAIATDSSEYCYCAGSTEMAANGEDALLIKYNLAGERQWTAVWGGSNSECMYDVLYYGNHVYTTGMTSSFGAGGTDVLLQCWTTEGQVVWSRVIGTANYDQGHGLTRDSEYLYVAGTTGPAGDYDVLLLKFGCDNTYKWVRTWDGGGSDVANSIEWEDENLMGNFAVHITGTTSSAHPGGLDVLYLEVSASNGDIEQERVWHADSGSLSSGERIALSGAGTLLRLAIAGEIGAVGSGKALLLEVDEGSSSLVRSWTALEDTIAYDLTFDTGGFDLCAVGCSRTQNVAAVGFALAIDRYTYELSNSSAWSDGMLDTGFFAVAGLPGTGVVAGGCCRTADPGSWASAAGTWEVPTGSWADFSGTAGTILLSFANPTTAAQLLTTGVEDTGGGVEDALVAVAEFP
ncbi:hypothetical protein JW859_08700 [bacterium]|nr:hypothetical protein [bacterium]